MAPQERSSKHQSPIDSKLESMEFILQQENGPSITRSRSVVAASSCVFRRDRDFLRNGVPSSCPPDPLPSADQELESNKCGIYSVHSKSYYDTIVLMICATGICTSYMTYGFIQEKYFGRKNKLGSVTLLILISQCVTNTLVSIILIALDRSWGGDTQKKQYNEQFRDDIQQVHGITCTADSVRSGLISKHQALNQKLLILTSVCYAAAMTATNESLSYVSYPTAVLAKSSKLIPTMIMGRIVNPKSFTMDELLGAILITGGIIIFNLDRLGIVKWGGSNELTGGTTSIHSSIAHKDNNSTYGYVLLLFSLFMDGLLASCQSLLKNSTDCCYNENKQKDRRTHTRTWHRPPTAMETMLFTNLYSIPLLVPLAIWSGQWQKGIHIIKMYGREAEDTIDQHHISLFHAIVLLNMSAALGQIFVSITIKCFSPQMCTTITTTRKFLTILFSVNQYGHVFSIMQWMAVFLVFGGLYLEIRHAHSAHVQLSKTTSSEKGEKRKAL